MFNNLHFRKRDLYQSSNLNKQLGETYSSFKCYYNHCRTEYATITGSFWHFHYLTGLFTLVQNYSTKFIETILLYPFRICSEVTLKPSWNTSWYNWFFTYSEILWHGFFQALCHNTVFVFIPCLCLFVLYTLLPLDRYPAPASPHKLLSPFSRGIR